EQLVGGPTRLERVRQRDGYRYQLPTLIPSGWSWACHASSVQMFSLGAGETAQRLRALAALPEDLGSIPSTHMEAHNGL
ncbi:hypothetical protein LEMLEM_LOCUS8322, partial [Lemmus lemmus]